MTEGTVSPRTQQHLQSNCQTCSAGPWGSSNDTIHETYLSPLHIFIYYSISVVLYNLNIFITDEGTWERCYFCNFITVCYHTHLEHTRILFYFVLFSLAQSFQIWGLCKTSTLNPVRHINKWPNFQKCWASTTPVSLRETAGAQYIWKTGHIYRYLHLCA